MIRRPLTRISFFSLLLAAVIVLWVRSPSHLDHVCFRLRPTRCYEIASGNGLLVFADRTGFAATVAADEDVARGISNIADWQREWQRGRYFQRISDPTAPAGEQAAGYQLRPVPHWLVATAFAILPLCRLPALVRSGQRSRFACRSCGYDLRATRKRCPECGSPAGCGYW